ncbi:MAG: TonB-dependent receptor [Balneolales bacterium]|nr:TonB-dependent receptor [Balneolales bacterium]
MFKKENCSQLCFNAFKVFFFAIVFMMFTHAEVSQAQDSSRESATGSISGRVTDARSGEPLIAANVGVEGSSLGASTDADGFYTIQGIPTGTVVLVATYVGYEQQRRINIQVRSAGNRDINFEMQPSAQDLDELVFTVSEPFRTPDESLSSFRRLSPEEIATYPAGNSDIAKVVQSLPGVSGSVTGFRNDVIIRGGAPNENIYFIDGIEIPTINHFSTQGSAGGPVGLLNVSFFDGVELSTSAFGARYGNALSGVLQFNQRTGNDREFRTNFRVGASEAALTAEGPLFKGDANFSNTTFIASIRRSYLQLLFQLIDLPFLPDYWDYQYKINHVIDGRNEVYLTGVGSIDDFRINVPDEANEEQQAILEQIPVIRQRTNTTGIAWRNRLVGGNGFWLTSLSSSWFYNDFSRFRDNVNQDGLFLQNQATEFRNTLRTELRYFAGENTWNTGISLRHNRFENKFLDDNTGISFDDAIGFWSYGIFGQWSRSLFNNRLNVTAGIRADGNSFTDTGNEIYRTLSPRAGINYRIDEAGQWRATASAGRYFKKPPLNLLGFRENGVLVNRDADYIRSDHLTLGFEYFPRSSTKFGVEGFVKWYDNYPVSVAEGVSLANLGGGFEVLGNEDVLFTGKGRTYGTEFLFQQKFERNFYAILAYTLFWSEFTGTDTSLYLPSAWDSRHLLSFTGGYRLGDSWEFSARSRFIGRTPFAPVDEERTIAIYPAFAFDYGGLATERLGVFTSTDIRIDRKWNFSSWSLDVYLEVQNILGQDTPSTPSFLLRDNENGEPVLRQVEEVGGSAILPTIGIIIDF